MCVQLHIENQNSQALEALCLWMYAKFNRCICEYDTALKYISSAYQLLEHCEPCEAHILVYYCHGCIYKTKQSNQTLP